MSDVSIDTVTSTLGENFEGLVKPEDLNETGAFDTSSKKRLFTFVIWKDSIDFSLFCQNIENLHIPAVISPLHDLDKKDNDKEDGELKKPHWHVIMQYANPRYLKPVRRDVAHLVHLSGGII